MRIDDETVRAHRAVRRLRDLYDAYRATSWAQELVLREVQDAISRTERPPTAERARVQSAVAERIADAGSAGRVFSLLRDQLRRRLLDLEGLPELP